MAITLKEAIKKLEESGKTISDKDRKELMKKPATKKARAVAGKAVKGMTGMKGRRPRLPMSPAKTVSDKDVDTVRGMTGMKRSPGMTGMKSRSPQPTPTKTMSDRDVRMGMRSAKTVSDRDVAMMKMKEGGKVTEFGKAFAKARKKFLADTGPATFTFKGKKFNVQTAQDRKTTIGKKKARKEGITGGRPVSTTGKKMTSAQAQRAGITVPSRKTTASAKVRSPVERARKRRGAPKGLSKAQTRALGLTGTARRSQTADVKSDIKAAGARKAADVKSEAAKIKRAKTVVGTALGAAGAGKVATKVLPKVATKLAAAGKTVKDVSAVARGKAEKAGKTRQLRRDKKGRVSEISKKNIARGQTIRKKATDVKKLAATTTRIGVQKGQRTGEALRDKKGRVSGISKKTIEKGRKIRRGAAIGAGAVGAAAAATAAAKAAQKERNMRLGGTFKGTF